MVGDSKNRLHQVVKGLIAATKSRRIAWQETDRAHAYQYVSGDTSIIVATADNDGIAPFELQLLDAHGSLIDTLRSTWYQDSESEEWTTDEFAPWSDDLRELHSCAQRSAKNVEHVLDRLLAEFPPDSEPRTRAESHHDFKVGDRVTHDKFGDGTVVAADGEGRRRAIKVDFGANGTVRLMLIPGVPLYPKV